MWIFRCFLLLLLCALSGCASTDKEAVVDDNTKFYSLLKEFRNSANTVSYDTLWHAYLNSDQIKETSVKQDEYLSIAQQLDSGELHCKDVDWEYITHQNFWSIKPHISAQACYELQGDVIQASFHTSAIEFLLSGILSSGDGENYYTAYEIATWGDASDVIEFAGYEVIGSYLELKHYGQALYFVYVVNDPESGTQKEIYFENNKFLHQIMDIQYPFGGINNQMKKVIVDSLAKSDTNAKIAKATSLTSERKYDEAVNVYLDAINDGSAIANYRLGILCHSEKQTVLPRSDCVNYLFDAAEMDYLNASIALAFIYKEGIEVEKNEKIFSEIMASTESRLEPGDVWFRFANFYTSIPSAKDDVKYRKYLHKATAKGSLSAELTSILLDAQDIDDEDKTQVLDIMKRLGVTAGKGLDEAQAAYANLLMKLNEKGSAKWNEAKLWLDKSAAQGHPFSNYLLGYAYEYGFFGEKDLLKAYFAFNEAALDYYADAQLKIGYFNDIGQVVEQNKRLAMSWYFLCSKSGNLTCLRNLGFFFEKGHVVEKSFNIAAEFYSQGCKKRDGLACAYLGNIHREGGNGVEQNHDRANELFKQACELKHMIGCNNLANSYENGWGVDKDYTQAAELYRKACDRDFSMSCSNLGYMYRHGTAFEKDLSKARELYLKACNGGNTVGCLNYNSLQAN